MCVCIYIYIYTYIHNLTESVAVLKNLSTTDISSMCSAKAYQIFRSARGEHVIQNTLRAHRGHGIDALTKKRVRAECHIEVLPRRQTIS